MALKGVVIIVFTICSVSLYTQVIGHIVFLGFYSIIHNPFTYPAPSHIVFFFFFFLREWGLWNSLDITDPKIFFIILVHVYI